MRIHPEAAKRRQRRARAAEARHLQALARKAKYNQFR